MVTPHLSVRSSKARDLAQKLARRENRTIADIVERALETYEAREAGREPAAKFYSRLHRSRVRISMSTASSMKTDALTKASSFDFSRHECDVGDFEESSSFCPLAFDRRSALFLCRSGGGTGYVALMGLAGFAPAVIKPSALALNILGGDQKVLRKIDRQ